VFAVTVPYTPTFRYSAMYGWEPLYRLYFQSNHWVTGIDEGPDGGPWYILTDDLLKVEYFVQAEHLQRLPDSAFAPITPEVENKRIEVSLKYQTVTCYENDQVALHAKVSTGIPSLGPTTNGIPTETPRGHFNVSMKTPVRHMGNGQLTSSIHAYELPGVPWSVFFTETGVAFHGPGAQLADGRVAAIDGPAEIAEIGRRRRRQAHHKQTRKLKLPHAVSIPSSP